MPGSVAPMLCTLTREVIQDEKFLYELKWDGYRIISFVQKGKVRMSSGVHWITPINILFG